MRTLFFTSVLSAALVIVGCKPAAKVTPPDPLAQLPVGRNLAEQLQAEAAQRPDQKVTPRAEEVLAALTTAGISVEAPRQYLGRTVHAVYCYGGTTPGATAVTLCEYPSAEAARAGLEHSEKQFAGIPRRTLKLNRQSVLTLVQGAETPAAAAEATRAAEIFASL